MMKQLFNNDDGRRGQVGIGTLIVFIAMVLVAAIAAGVLINTAGFLQTQAEDTGTESTEQVADNLNVITTVGDVGSSGDTIDEAKIGVQPAAGAGNINLEEVTIQFVSDNSFANQVHIQDVETSGQSQVVFGTDAITAEDETDNVMTDNADRYEIIIPLGTEHTLFTYYAGGDGLTADSDSGIYDVTGSSGTYDGSAGDQVEFSGQVDDDALDGTDTSNDEVQASFLDNLDNSGLSELVEGEEVELTLTTEAGGQTVAVLQVPDSLAGDASGDTIEL